MLSKRDFVMMMCCRETVIDGKPVAYLVQNSVNLPGYEPTQEAIRATMAMCASVQQHNETDLRLTIVQ